MFQLKPLQIDSFHLGITDNFVAADTRASEKAYNMVVLPDMKMAVREGSVLDWNHPTDPNYQTYNLPTGLSSYLCFGIVPDPRDGADRPIRFFEGVQFISAPSGALTQANFNFPLFTTADGDAGSSVHWSRYNSHIYLNANPVSGAIEKVMLNRMQMLYVGQPGKPEGESEITKVVFVGDSTGALAGKYWTFNLPGESFYIWYQYSRRIEVSPGVYEIWTLGTDPALPGKTGLKVTFIYPSLIPGYPGDPIYSTVTAEQVKVATSSELIIYGTTYDGLYLENITSNTLKMTNTQGGAVTDSSAGTSGFTVTKLQDGKNPASASLQIRPAGLPAIKRVGKITATGPGTGHSYRYAFCYKYRYSIGDLYFEMRGPVIYYPDAIVLNGKIDGGSSYYTTINKEGNTIEFFNFFFNIIPDHPEDFNYDLSSGEMKIEVYRTVENGTTYRYAGEFVCGYPLGGVNGTYLDNVSDDNLGQPLYTTGNAASNDPPPFCRFMHITELGTAYYGYYVDTTPLVGNTPYNSLLANGFLQSKVGRPWAAPLSFSGEIDDEITGISSVKETPIICSRFRTYRVDGKLDDYGAGILAVKTISQDYGSLSHEGIAQTPLGVFFPSEVGFCYSDGFQVRKISEHFNKTYAQYFSNYTLARRCQATYDGVNNRVYWAVDSGRGDNTSVIFVLHLNHGVSSTSCFTLWGGDFTSDSPDVVKSFSSPFLLFWNQSLFRMDSRGWVCKFLRGEHNDPRITDSRFDHSLLTPIAYDWRSAATDFGVGSSRKWTPKFNIFFVGSGDYATTSLSVQPYVNRDSKSDAYIKECKLIRRTNLAGQGLVSVMRRTPTPGIRASYRTFGLRPAIVEIYNSDDFGGVAAYGTVSKVLQLPAGVSFPTEILDYYISFDVDNYVAMHRIVDIPAHNQVTLATGPTGAPVLSVNWKMLGKKRGDVMHLSSVTMMYDDSLGGNLTPYRTGEEAGGNG